MIDAFMITFQHIWETKTWPEEWKKSLIIMISKKGNFCCCKNYITISLISHPSKIMLIIIHNRLKGKADHYQDLYHDFIDLNRNLIVYGTNDSGE